jgi:N-acetyl sugar amidotransferase
MAEKLEAYYGLPEEVYFCERCVMSNQRPSSFPEFRHGADRRTPTLGFQGGVCDACRFAEMKLQINWEAREKELIQLLDEHRRDDGEYDCIVPGSGGKDSIYASHILKYKYGMHPLTVTWPPTLYTDYGLQNFNNWIEIGGFDNITFKPNGRAHRLLTKLAIENLLHPFQTFILGQKTLAPKLAAKYGIPLVFYGESEVEYGNPIAGSDSAVMDTSIYTMGDLSVTYLGGVPVTELIDDHGLSLNELKPYLPVDFSTADAGVADVDVHYLGYYIKWVPQEAYYYSVEHAAFQARPVRTEGTYSKYNSIDDKLDDLHYYTTYIKFGLGRATYDAAQEIRNNHLTREEGVALVQRFDGEFPHKYFEEVLNFLNVNPERFLELCDEFRSPHLWESRNGKWKLRHQVC